MPPAIPSGPRASYDAVARRYAESFVDELDSKPFDRAFLDEIAAESADDDWTVDLGCGPSQIGTYLSARGVRVRGVDLSYEMLHEARRLVAELKRVGFEVMDIRERVPHASEPGRRTRRAYITAQAT